MGIDIKKSLREYQREQLAKRQTELEKNQQEYENYLASEQHERDSHNHNESLWQRKAQKEGWHYTPQPFVSAADRERMAQKAKEEEIAYLKEKLAKLEND